MVLQQLNDPLEISYSFMHETFSTLLILQRDSNSDDGESSYQIKLM